jgi:hypothetical protein
LHAYTALLDAEEVVQVGDWSVTSVARTIVDLGRTLPFEPVLLAADHALHCGLVSPEELAAQLDRGRRLPGALAASRVVSFADGRSRSLGESRSRIMIHRAGLPAPELQLEILDGEGKHVADADFGFRRRRVVGQYDGKPKRIDSSDLATVARDESAKLQAAGWAVVRWMWVDLDNPAEVIANLQQALRRPGR